MLYFKLINSGLLNEGKICM